jgi:heme A synthase
MRTMYRGLTHLINVLVAVQAALMAWAISGLGKFVSSGGVIDPATMESEEFPFPELAGFMFHGIIGSMLIPLIALLLLILSFFTKVPGASKWAGIVLALVVIQVALGMSARMGQAPILGLIHGINALLLFTAAMIAGLRMRRFTKETAAAAPAGTPAPGYVG